MPVVCRTIIEMLEAWAPLKLAEPWDNVGLLVGSPEQQVECVIVSLDVSAAAVMYAREQGAGLIISHHPVIFKQLKSLRTDEAQGKLLASLLNAGIAVYAAHTNLDKTAGGVNDALAALIGLSETKPLCLTFRERLVKLVVFVPETHVDVVRNAIANAGAGHIGNYSHCTFQSSGIGTFLPLDGAKPYLGEQGKLEFAAECRLETILPESIIGRVLAAMQSAHPYEEVAYDLYPVLNQVESGGMGRIGNLGRPMTLRDLALHVKAKLAADFVRVCGGLSANVARVAVCGGSGAELIREAVRAGADVLITGDVRYHEAQEAAQAGMAIIDAGHFATEQPVVEAVAAYLRQCAQSGNWDVRILAHHQDKDIFTVF
ncbi:MAG: Nif3-like dinuclear metal center hexameric protein [Negativicutes bacterium]|nr:Nif3-like dinuclear metal center hexameric protein [Negativicutes bacterium]